MVDEFTYKESESVYTEWCWFLFERADNDRLNQRGHKRRNEKMSQALFPPWLKGVLGFFPFHISFSINLALSGNLSFKKDFILSLLISSTNSSVEIWSSLAVYFVTPRFSAMRRKASGCLLRSL